jgi:hypothetical protein
MTDPRRSCGPLQHAVASVDHAGGGRQHLGALDLELGEVRQALQQPGALPQEHRDDVELELVDQARPQVLLRDVRAAADDDILVAGAGAWSSASWIPVVTNV